MTGSHATVVVLVAHGSRAEAANDAHRAMSERVATAGGVPVVPAFLELAEPSIGEGIDRAVELGATTVRVIPYFLYPGRHVRDDIPRIVAEAAERHGAAATIELAAHVGDDPRMVQLLAELAQGRR